MRDCPLCGEERPNHSQRGDLVTQLDPPGAWWGGRLIALPPARLRLLDLLCRRGKVAFLVAEAVVGRESSGSNVVSVAVCHLRKALPPEVKVRTIHGWGYELIIHDKQEEAA